MRVLEWIEDNIGAAIVALVAAVFASIGGWLLMIFVGAMFFRGEMSYGIPLALGIPAGLVAAVVVFRIVFRKLS